MRRPTTNNAVRVVEQGPRDAALCRFVNKVRKELAKCYKLGISLESWSALLAVQ